MLFSVLIVLHLVGLFERSSERNNDVAARVTHVTSLSTIDRFVVSVVRSVGDQAEASQADYIPKVPWRSYAAVQEATRSAAANPLSTACSNDDPRQKSPQATKRLLSSDRIADPIGTEWKAEPQR